MRLFLTFFSSKQSCLFSIIGTQIDKIISVNQNSQSEKLRNRIELFKENTALGGYSIAVRDDWSFKIKRLHITVTEKEAYEKKFENKILIEKEFLDW